MVNLGRLPSQRLFTGSLTGIEGGSTRGTKGFSTATCTLALLPAAITSIDAKSSIMRAMAPKRGEGRPSRENSAI
jgi:hypothetical protein